MMLIAFIMVLFVVAGVIGYEWRMYGIAPDQGEIGWQKDQFIEESPIIDAHSCRFEQGEKVMIQSLVKVRDVDGEILTSQVEVTDEEGKILRGELNTDQPGKYVLTVSAVSRHNQKTSQKTFVVLIDGRIPD